MLLNPFMQLSSETIIYFFIYAVIGWICEFFYCGVIDKKFENRGFLFGPYCPIYGAGALLIVYILQPLSHSATGLFFYTIIVCTPMEYFVGWAMEKVFHMRWWDYSNQPLNLNGRICALNSILFGLMGLLLVYVVHPFVVQLLGQIPTRFDEHTIAVTIIVLIAIDFVLSSKSLQLAFKHLSELKVYLEQFRANQADKDKKHNVRENIREMVRRLSKLAKCHRLPGYGINLINKLRSINIIENYKLRQILRSSESMDLHELKPALEALKAYHEEQDKTVVATAEDTANTLENAITQLLGETDENAASEQPF